MKTQRRFLALAFLLSILNFQPSISVHAATTIDPVNKYAYGANIGWMDWYADGANGAVMKGSVPNGP